MDWENTRDVLKALVLLYSLQTIDEQRAGVTVHDNGVGFSGSDSGFLTSVAQQILIEKRGISQKQFDATKRLLLVHRKQIERFGIENIELPPTAIIWGAKKKEESKAAGVFYCKENKLYFKPYIYPTTVLKQYDFKWQGQDIGWEGGLTLDRYEQVKDIFPEVEIDKSIEDWLKQLEGDVVLHPVIAESELFGYQKQAAGFLLSRHNNGTDRNRAILGLAPGLGKTAVAIHAAASAGGKVLVISPLSLLFTWKKEIIKWLGPDQDIDIWHGYYRYPEDLSQWTIVNYETALYYLVQYDTKTVKNSKGKPRKVKINWRAVYDFGFSTIIIDESILIKSRHAQRANAVDALAKRVDNAWELSGSPVSRYFDDLWFQLHVLDPKRFSSYWKFARQYCIVEKNNWGWSITGNQPDAEARLKRDLRDIYFARTQEQVLDIPDWIFEDMEIPMEDKQFQPYLEMETLFKANLPKGDVILAPNILTQMLRLMQLASNPMLVGGDNDGAKWNALPEILDFVEHPVIIWTNFIDTAKYLKKQFEKSYHIAVLTGETKAANRQYIVDRLQSGDLDLLIAHPAVGKFGLTLTAARTAIYLERSYNGDDYYQSLYRVKRIGTKHSPHIIHMLATKPNGDNTIDHVIHRVLKHRKDNSIAITSGEIRRYFEETI